MSDSVISVENLGKKYRIKHQAERQRYTALRDVLADRTKSAARRLWSVLRPYSPFNVQSSIVRCSSGSPLVPSSLGPLVSHCATIVPR